MKKVRCFLVVSLISVIAIVLTGFTYQFNDVLTDAQSGESAGPVLLQLLIAVKYLTLLLVFKPEGTNINQLSLGFITSDLLIVILSFSSPHVFMLPLHILMIQILVVLISLWVESPSMGLLMLKMASFFKTRSIIEVIQN